VERENTLPKKYNIARENIGHPKSKLIFQPLIFSGSRKEDTVLEKGKSSKKTWICENSILVCWGWTRTAKSPTLTYQVSIEHVPQQLTNVGFLSLLWHLYPTGSMGLEYFTYILYRIKPHVP